MPSYKKVKEKKASEITPMDLGLPAGMSIADLLYGASDETALMSTDFYQAPDSLLSDDEKTLRYGIWGAEGDVIEKLHYLNDPELSGDEKRMRQVAFWEDEIQGNPHLMNLQEEPDFTGDTDDPRLREALMAGNLENIGIPSLLTYLDTVSAGNPWNQRMDDEPAPDRLQESHAVWEARKEPIPDSTRYGEFKKNIQGKITPEMRNKLLQVLRQRQDTALGDRGFIKN